MPETQLYMPNEHGTQSKDAVTLSAMAAESGHSAQLSVGHQQLFLGFFKALSFPSGLRAHAMDATELRVAESALTLHPSLSVGVLLEGRIGFELAGQSHELEAEPDSPLFFMMNTLAPSPWRRKLQAGQKVRKIVLSVSADWLAHRPGLNKSLQRLLLHHNLVRSHRAYPGLAKQAESFLGLFPTGDELSLEVAAFRLFESACHFMQETLGYDYAQQTVAQPCREDQAGLALRVRDFLESRVIPCAGLINLDLTLLAQELGASSSTLQRKFKRAFSITIHEYTRERKMQLAKEALIKHNISIGEAAYLAGYKHYPNFVSAFKTMFGQSPGAWKAQILQARS